MARINLSDARVLLSNDDGIEAPGLVLLEKLIRPLVRELWIIAPRHEQSATSHALTIHSPLRIHELGERRFAVTGTGWKWRPKAALRRSGSPSRCPSA